MISNVMPYPAYRDSGLPWLRQVPAHWEVRKLKYLVSFTGGCTPSKGVAAYWQGDVPWVSPKDMSRAVLDDTSDHISPEAIQSSATTLVPAGAVLLVVRSGTLRRRIPVAINRVPMALNQDMKALQAEGKLAIAAYLVALIQGNQRALLAEWTKQGATVESIEHDLLANSVFPIPPLPEQTGIVRFLDYVDRRVRRVIRARQRQIKLLEEYRQALIHQAVTGQIDVRTGKPYPEYEDSGVEWLGQVPTHWEVRRLKHVARLNPSKSEVPWSMRTGAAVFLPMERVAADGRFDAGDVRPVSELWNGLTYFRRGDVLVAKITPCFENGKGACLDNLPTDIGFGSTEFHVIRPSSKVTGPFLYRVTTLSDFRRLGADEMTGAAGQQRVPASFLASFPMPVPPIPEQTAITQYLDAETAKIDAAIATIRREIELLREYRERLISDVVTGKLDVREAAARLPEEPDDDETELAEAEESTEAERDGPEEDDADA